MKKIIGDRKDLQHTLNHLELHDGSVLVVQFPTRTTPDVVNQVMSVYEQSLANLPHAISVLVCFENSQEIMAFDEKQMAEMGWVRRKDFAAKLDDAKKADAATKHDAAKKHEKHYKNENIEPTTDGSNVVTLKPRNK